MFSNIPFKIKLTSSLNLTENVNTTIETIKQNYLARLEIKRPLPLAKLINTTINQTPTNSKKRVKLIVSIISKQENEPNLNSIQTLSPRQMDHSWEHQKKTTSQPPPSLKPSKNFYSKQLTDWKKRIIPTT
jgi:hypothetical protein